MRSKSVGSALLLSLGFAIGSSIPAAIPATSADKISQAIVTARHVAVVVLSASGPGKTTFPTPPRTQNADVEVRNAVEDAFRKWGRYVVTIDPRAADIVVAVRSGRIASVNGGGIGSVGTRGVGTGGVGGGEIGPARDIMDVYLPSSQGEGTRLWRGAEDGGLDLPDLPLFEKFKKQVEETAKKKK